MSAFRSEAFNLKKEQGHVQISDAEEHSQSSDDVKEPPVRTVQNRVLNANEKYWLFEFFGWTLALGCFIGTAALLAVHNGRQSPSWTITVGAGHYRKSFGLTINTIISLFATAFNSGLLIPVAASVSQLKWIWFQKGRRPLAHFQTFESAARGPLGSLMLLWTLRGRRLACLGSVIIIAALGTGFSFQALVVYPLKPVQVGIARIQRTNFDYGSGIITDLSNDEIGAIYSGIYQYSDMSEVKNVSCSTGNCTWPETYTSLAVCSKCFDVTDSLTKSCGTIQVPSVDDGSHPVTNLSLPYCNYTLPNGLKATGVPSGNFSMLEMSGKREDSVHFDADASLTVFSIIRTDWSYGVPDWGSLTPEYGIYGIDAKQAVECAAYYCVQKFNASVSQGKLSEKQIDTYTDGFFLEEGSPVYELYPPPSFTNTSDDNDANVYRTTNILPFQDFFATQWIGRVFEGGNPVVEYPTTPLAWFMYGLFYMDSPLDQFKQMFGSLAKSLSDNIRAYTYTQDTTPATANGITWQDKPHVQVRWGWLALPAALLFLSLLLLIATIVSTAKEKTLLWKGSSLAAFSHPLTSDARAEVSDVRSPREVLRVAERMEVKWERTERGFRLVRPHEA